MDDATTLDMLCAALEAAKSDDAFSAAADGGEVLCTVEENGDITLKAGDVSKTISASVLMGEAEEEASEDAMPEPMAGE